MHDASIAANAARQGGRDDLARALLASRQDTLARAAEYEAGLPGLTVPQRAELNPPLWELGHIGWFQAHWLGRNPQRALGHQADPDAPRHPSPRAEADALYNSSQVPHGSRWQLPLPDAQATRADLAEQLDHSLALLAAADETPQALYFFRLALFHEDMHHEAALYMAQSLGLAVDGGRWRPQPLPPPPAPLRCGPGPWRLGSGGQPGFAFDNELADQDLSLAAYEVDAQARRWDEFLPFVEGGGYADPRWWDEAGQAWLARSGAKAPRYLRHDGQRWWQQRWGRWQTLALDEAACHLTAHEARAWCRWAGRRLPSEAEWECAALSHPAAFRWADVWEWTASPFAPYPGFVAHPYRDYSQPWFGSRSVLRGAAFLTQPRMRHPRYRNFFTDDRNDVPAGLRSCALAPQ